jgi:hypothetical protein
VPWPVRTTLEPTITSTHSPTVTLNVIELLSGGVLPSAAQTVIKLVVLPWSQVGFQVKIPFDVMLAPAGALESSVNEIGPLAL